MRHLLWLGVFTSCATSPEAPLSSATFSESPAVHSARAQPGFVSYGAPYHTWTITVATIEGCAGDSAAAVEIDTLSGVTDLPLGPIAMRTAETTIATLPSAYLRYPGRAATAGTITIDTASASVITGSWTAQVMVGGTPTEVTASFSAPVCATE